jgi:PIN domain nuclease of toxin-antitoxin system
MPDAVADTHSLIWYLEDDPRLGPEADRTFEACDRGELLIYLPTICLVEIVYLQEKGRIPADLKARLDAELQSGTTGLVLADLTAGVVEALTRVPRTHVPDMPDRIITATALHLALPLMTRDHKIQQAGVRTIW